jgi:hypothetical protein
MPQPWTVVPALGETSPPWKGGEGLRSLHGDVPVGQRRLIVAETSPGQPKRFPPPSKGDFPVCN